MGLNMRDVTFTSCKNVYSDLPLKITFSAKWLDKKNIVVQTERFTSV